MGIHLQNDAVKGKGYGTQAERLILQYAFEELGMVAVNADAALKNTRSQHVLEKVGFRYTHEDDTFKYYRCERVDLIRSAEAKSHIEAYTSHSLFSPGSWLAKPVKTVMELLPLFQGYTQFTALDLGSGVGRNCIPVAQHFSGIPCRVDCVDILELAIAKLNENAQQYGVENCIRGIVSSIDDYEIDADSYEVAERQSDYHGCQGICQLRLRCKVIYLPVLPGQLRIRVKSNSQGTGGILSL